MASIESVIKGVAELLGHDAEKIDVEILKDGKLLIVVHGVDEEDFDDADDDFDDDE